MASSDGRKNTNRKFDTKSLRFKLTLAFVLFTLLLMGSMWLMQTVSLEAYYQRSMEKKTELAIKGISQIYSNDAGLDMETFSKELVDLSNSNDIYFYIEDESHTYSITSRDFSSRGRFFASTERIVALARDNLAVNDGKETSFIMDEPDGSKMVVRAARVESAYRDTIYLYAIAALTPLGPTVSILSSLLMIATIEAIFLGGLFALLYSKRFSRPISVMNTQAKELGKGNYDVHFDCDCGFTEVDELAETLNSAAEDLGKSNALQRDLLANVSHDLRTPLTMVKSYAEMIRDISGDDKERRDEHLGVIIEEADRLSDLVGDILLLSKIQSGTMEFDIKPFEIQAAAGSVIATYKVMEQENYEFVTRGMPCSIIVNADESRIQQVFSNLISNAVRYSKKDGGKITVAFERVARDKVRCSVSDNGIGIAEEDIDSIWNRYQKASRQNQRAANGSTGLGLSIVREILERHGAEYGVYSKVGEGSTFWFVLSADFENL